jgi:hypothetical protein
MTDMETRVEIGKLLIGRCTNCYDWLTTEANKYKSVSTNGKWVGHNVGPFCQSCYDMLMKDINDTNKE